MNKFIKFTGYVLVFLALTVSSTVDACCKQPKAGPPGPQGATGATGPAGTLVSNYASAASDIQSIIFTGANFPINFPTDLVPPVGVVHPYLGDDSRF
jgi:hypothetical protein